MSTEKIATVIAKINHLRNLSKSSNANEAAAAAAAADRIIAQYQLSEADLEIKGADGEKISVEHEFLYKSGKVAYWKHELATVLSRHYGCAFFTTRLYDNTKLRGTVMAFQMVGRKSDIEITQYMFAWLTGEIERLTKQEAYGRGTSVSQSYSRGCVAGIKEQLDSEHLRQQREAAHAGLSQAMVLLDNRHQLARETMYRDVKGIRAVSKQTNVSHSAGAFENGRERGREIKLNKGISSGTASKFLK